MKSGQTEVEIMACLCRLAAEQVSLDVQVVTPDSDLFADLNFDSLDAVEFVMIVEDEFDVSIDDRQAEGVRTPRQALAMLMAGLESRPTPS